jgi:tRNA pseudouridine55 synthase
MEGKKEELPGYFERGQVLMINKPLDWTSFDVVRKIRGLVRTRKVGHAGTLDPLATGLLILCTGKYTKRINEFMAKEKEYRGTLTLGATTRSFDLETEPENFRDISGLRPDQIQSCFSEFRGDIMQVPPQFSALKKAGQRSYALARKGQELVMEARKITIRELEITGIEIPEVHFRTVCTTGTYIRSLAHDIGKSLGVGAYLSELCRTRIGEFTLEQALSLAQAEEEIRKILDIQKG